MYVMYREMYTRLWAMCAAHSIAHIQDIDTCEWAMWEWHQIIETIFFRARSRWSNEPFTRKNKTIKITNHNNNVTQMHTLDETK